MTEAGELELLDVAREAAAAGAAELMARYGRQPAGLRRKSTPTDLVSEADVASERAIRAVIEARRPDDAIVGEEEGSSGDGETRWFVDPLDGTINYLYEIPMFAVSIACEDSSGTLAGVVLDPVRSEWFTATRSGEARLGDEPLHGGRDDELGQIMVATGFHYSAELRARQAVVLERLLPRVRDIRRAGAAALDLAWSASGRYDAFYERGLNPWDYAAGALVAERAGLVVRELPAADGDPFGIAAAPPGVIDELLSLVLGE